MKNKVPKSPQLWVRLFAIIFILFGIYSLHSCQKEEVEAKNPPKVATTAISAISSNTANSGGSISSDGGAAITARGIVWDTKTAPTISLSTKTTDGLGTGNFTSNLSGLLAATKYYVRAYATNSVGTTYGDEVSFTTSATLATIATNSISNINKTTASSGGTISSDGGAAITVRGLVWDTKTDPAISLSTKTTDGPGSRNFTSSMFGLSAATKYYVRAYATNSTGTSYGNELSFTTLPN